MLRENRSPEIASAGNNPGNPVISFLSEADAGEVTELYAGIFLADEPTSVRIAPDPARLLPLAHWYVGLLARRGFSFVARAPHTGEPVGFLFSFDITDDFCEDPLQYAAYLDNFREAIAMIDELEQRFLNRSSIPPGAVLHALQGGVSRDYRGRGLIRAMMDRLVIYARERGYRQIIAECTNPPSHKALLAYGFRQAGFLAYDTFLINGTPYFAGLSGGLSLMVLDL